MEPWLPEMTGLESGMSVTTYEGVVENGQIRLDPEIELPEHVRVYVVVPDAGSRSVARIMSPRLAHPEQVDFQMTMTRIDPDASV
jgi:hypothetical protein